MTTITTMTAATINEHQQSTTVDTQSTTTHSHEHPRTSDSKRTQTLRLPSRRLVDHHSWSLWLMPFVIIIDNVSVIIVNAIVNVMVGCYCDYY